MSRGGKRPGAGAPPGNTNALKHGSHSRRIQLLLRDLIDVPQFRELLCLLRPRILSTSNKPSSTKGGVPGTVQALRSQITLHALRLRFLRLNTALQQALHPQAPGPKPHRRRKTNKKQPVTNGRSPQIWEKQ